MATTDDTGSVAARIGWVAIVVALVALGLIVGTAFAVFPIFVGLPILLLIGIAWFFFAVVRRSREATSMRRHRQAAAPRTEFTERDRETLEPSQGAPESDAPR